jgi:hypothetical protein
MDPARFARLMLTTFPEKTASIGLRRPSLDKGLEEAGLTGYAITAFIQQSV